jgi:uncharacterized delta-60 repeat protein
VALPTAAIAAPGDIDSSWGVDGHLPAPLGQSIGGTMLQPDGGIVMKLRSELRRAHADGTMDVGFGANGTVVASLPELVIAGFAQRPDGRLYAIWTSEPIYRVAGIVECPVRRWARYTARGQMEPASPGGTETILDPGCGGAGLVVDRGGHTYWLTRWQISWLATYTVSLLHVDPLGLRLPNVETVSQDLSKPWTLTWEPVTLVIDAHDRIVAGGYREGSAGFAVIRYAGQARDASFGTDGVAYVPTTGYVPPADVLPLPDGHVLAFSTVAAEGRRQPALVRFAERGRVDASFGTGGLAIAPLTRPGESLGALVVALAPDGRIVIAAEVSSAGAWYTRLARLDADGRPDARFGGAGISAATYGPGLRSLAVRPTGEIVLSLASEVVQLRGGDLSTPHPLRERLAVEYFHAGYGHYFMTADEAEIAILDAAVERAWKRTGKTFSVFDRSVLPFSPIVPMCRFWSDQSFAPKSSHFYTPYADECAQVKQDPVWFFERNAFYLRMPEGALGARTCPAGTQPLYRAYNQGAGGVPNHRYTTDPAVLDAMIVQGWVMEGEAATRVFACVPVQE